MWEIPQSEEEGDYYWERDQKWAWIDTMTNWQNIHPKIIDFRMKHNVSIMRFLELCSLHNYQHLWQNFCCKRGHELHPNFERGSYGRKFLDAVNKFFDSDEYFNFKNNDYIKSVEELVCDINHEQVEKLSELGVFGGLHYDDEQDSIIIDCPINPRYLGKTNEEGVRAFIREAIGDAVPVHFRRVELFLLSSPMVARNDDVYCTMSVVFVKSKMIALTCSHVVSGYKHVGA